MLNQIELMVKISFDACLNSRLSINVISSGTRTYERSVKRMVREINYGKDHEVHLKSKCELDA